MSVSIRRRSSNDEAGSLSRTAAAVSNTIESLDAPLCPLTYEGVFQIQMFNGSEQAPPSVNNPYVEIGPINDALPHVGVVFCQNNNIRPAFYVRGRDDFQREDGLMVLRGSWHKPRDMPMDRAQREYLDVLMETQRYLSAKLSVIRGALENATGSSPSVNTEEFSTVASAPGDSNDAIPPERLQAAFSRDPRDAPEEDPPLR